MPALYEKQDLMANLSERIVAWIGCNFINIQEIKKCP